MALTVQANRAVKAVDRFAATNPWAGDFIERKAKFLNLHGELSNIHGSARELVFSGIHRGAESTSRGSRITENGNLLLKGKMSVVTYLSLFARAYDLDGEPRAWAFDMFRICFPDKWPYCEIQDGRLVKVR